MQIGNNLRENVIPEVWGKFNSLEYNPKTIKELENLLHSNGINLCFLGDLYKKVSNIYKIIFKVQI